MNKTGTQHADLFAALAAPFERTEVKVRTQSGRQLHYVTARTVMNRLDEVLGPENWWDEYTPGEHSVLCKLTVRLPDGSLLTKADAGGYAGMADSGDDDKSGYSDAFKRAAVKFGVARYLYNDGVPAFAPGPDPAPTPAEPDQARHAAGRARREERRPHRTHVNAAPPAAPQDGRAMFRWAKDEGQRRSVDLVKYLTQWGRGAGFPPRIVHWEAEQIAAAYEEVLAKLDAHSDALSN